MGGDNYGKLERQEIQQKPFFQQGPQPRNQQARKEFLLVNLKTAVKPKA